ncbi:rhamnogalacturonan lyase [Streptomyces europaeiscabiei]|uniref:Rhamnogalacturonan lyase n=1 Tax=Streptomyces europaeiscabiei TaxID=146819 RepID=A0ABU4N8V4_9ACTN|nr:rhamnogalacturonan lyase [Streptomyces europaeiscabiei]MDX2527019.1 rhamnogalacturonan lyase [Streptomyces europaeiscabiei]MDX2769112.1 rhamnogalacturonan lyase [Streptomyces europaeiscabiei]MDX3542084.1 rhamnogalacturonan lyase [Streptomyces europaeiscabiei]MDX3551132.1 rhamnogalacturonan lyase [Streptomyces europaeiscabiei]MDX3665303.1 rhamnogalacturonan lyase [Streptomyces europaeiscabiei]
MQHPHRHHRRRALRSLVTAALVAAGLTTFTGTPAQAATARQVERLDRGVVSVHVDSGNLVSWRWLGTDPGDVSFNVYRAGALVNATPVTGSTNYFHSGAPAQADYTVRAIVGGVEQGDSVHAVQLRTGYKDVPISAPAGGTTPDGVAYTYEANDASVGDLDGDGALEFVLKWQPTNAKDNSQSGYTGNTIIDGVKLDGTRLWRVDLGRNIRSGAHYTQFQVYDYDGDGRAEIAAKTADGTVDGAGTVIGSSSADHRNSSGYVLSGPEYLTMFNGRTGRAMQTVDYVPARGTVSSWGDSYGNRVDRFLAGTAYLDGARPSLIMARGYYTRSVIAAWDWRNGSFTRRWTFDTSSSTNSGRGYDGQGSHSLSVGDVDNDGKDEIVYGAMAVDDNGNGLWTTRTGHGDAQHLGDLDASTSGLEYFKVSESTSQPAELYINPASGAVRWQLTACCDNGRGVAGDIYAGNDGPEMWSASDSSVRDEAGATKGREPSSVNFLSWWDGDPVRELLDGTRIDKYGTSSDTRLLTGSGVSSNNGTKATPALSGDILGDWREEVVWRTSGNTALRIYSTPIETGTKITTLLHDPMYRTGLAWQNTAYNQPPHTSFFIGHNMPTAPRPTVYTP